MRKAFLRYTMMLAALALSACGGDDKIVETSSPVGSLEDDYFDEDLNLDDDLYDMGSCTGNTNPKRSLVMNDGSYYQCIDGLWFRMEHTSSSKKAKSSSSSRKSASSSSEEESSSSESSLESSASEESSSSEENVSSSAESLPESSAESAPESSSSEEASSSSRVVIDLTLEYDCSEYNCAYTDYLNSKMLGSGMYGQYLDTRDNHVYRTVKIGKQTWMAQNLSYITANSRCYGDDPVYCYKYGRLYYQKEALTACPEGWHLPSPEEWDQLGLFVAQDLGLDKYSSVGNYLKSVDTWTVEMGFDLYGFSGIASRYYGNVHVCGGAHGVFWTSDDYEYRCLLNDRSDLYSYWESYSSNWAMSVRCLLDD